MYKISLIFMILMILIAGCGVEYGDVHGSAENFDIVMGLKIKADKIFDFRNGDIDFISCSLFKFPKKTENYFKNPPKEFFSHPFPLSYEKDKIFIEWTKTPFIIEHKHFFERSAKNARELGLKGEKYAELMNLVSTDKGYYAVSYEQKGKKIRNIDLYLINTETRELFKFIDTN